MSGTTIQTRYPTGSIILYNGVTVAHFGVAAAGLVIAFSRWTVLGWLLGVAYLIFAFAQMYVIMPLTVCPHCAYRTLDDSRCVTGLNLLSARFSRVRSPEDFGRRAEGVLCHNNLYMIALLAPLVVIALGLVLNYGAAALACLLVLVALMAFRYFILFKRVACPHCAMKERCPNAASMGLG